MLHRRYPSISPRRLSIIVMFRSKCGDIPRKEVSISTSVVRPMKRTSNKSGQVATLEAPDKLRIRFMVLTKQIHFKQNELLETRPFHGCLPHERTTRVRFLDAIGQRVPSNNRITCVHLVKSRSRE